MQGHILNFFVLGVSIISISIFVFVTFQRRKIVKKKAKVFGMKKQVTDPLLYWFSYTSAFIIIIMKIIMFFLIIRGEEEITSRAILLGDILPSILLIIFTRTIGKSMILRAEKKLYINRLMAETKNIHSFFKENNNWHLHTTTGTYPVSLTNTSIHKIADMTGADILDSARKKTLAKKKVEKQ